MVKYIALEDGMVKLESNKVMFMIQKQTNGPVLLHYKQVKFKNISAFNEIKQLLINGSNSSSIRKKPSWCLRNER